MTEANYMLTPDEKDIFGFSNPFPISAFNWRRINHEHFKTVPLEHVFLELFERNPEKPVFESNYRVFEFSRQRSRHE